MTRHEAYMKATQQSIEAGCAVRYVVHPTGGMDRGYAYEVATDSDLREYEEDGWVIMDRLPDWDTLHNQI